MDPALEGWWTLRPSLPERSGRMVQNRINDAGASRRMLERLAPLWIVLRDAARGDASAAELWRSFSDRRATNIRELVASVATAASGLRGELTVDDTADIVWATDEPEVFVLLTNERDRSAEKYGQWLANRWTPDASAGGTQHRQGRTSQLLFEAAGKVILG